MKIQHRVPFFFSLLFSLLLATVMLIVYYLFANFRTEEFKDRLSKKAETTVKLLLEVQEVDAQILKIIDRNTINKLYNEKTLIFNDSMRLIYSSIDDAVITWNQQDLKNLKEQQQIFRNDHQYDVLGRYFPYGGRDYYVLISAEDKSGQNKLQYLSWLLLGAFFTGTFLVWFISFYLGRKALLPLDKLRRQMQEINSKNLSIRIKEPKGNDEIKALSRSFNQMLDRIDSAYKAQKDFTSNASHELKTPLARIVTQLENFTRSKELNSQSKTKLKAITDEAYQLSEIISSLFLLSSIENNEKFSSFQTLRLDEIVFHAASKLSNQFPSFKLKFEIENKSSRDTNMEIQGDETLLQIALQNLLKNGWQYSQDGLVYCHLTQHRGGIDLVIMNSGSTPDISDTNTLFNTFTRGSNAKNIPGSGLGLGIVRRILSYHHAGIDYHILNNTINQIVVQFAKPA